MSEKVYHINDVDRLLEKQQFILDVREYSEFESGHISGVKHVPLGELDSRLEELPKEKEIYVYCQSGRRSEIAVSILNDKGFSAKNLTEGYSEYKGSFNSTHKNITSSAHKLLALGSLQCPGPLITVNMEMQKLNAGEKLEITVDDIGFSADIEAWAKKSGNKILKNVVENNAVNIIIEKQENQDNDAPKMMETKDGATMVVFSGDLDKALASFIIATGARSMGREVTMFFTFWGLSVIKDPNAKKIKKSGIDKLFSAMLPNSANHLPISKMNMLGAGQKMMKNIMNKKKVEALSTMIQKADNLGVKMIACTMSMDVMAIEKEELLPFVEFGGVGTYLGDTENSNLNLFI